MGVQIPPSAGAFELTIRIGTSGWVYQHWRGIFYPPEVPPRDWFAHYSHTFDTVEINNSFYRLPSEAAFDAWRAQASDQFLYAVKASRYITHLKKLKDPQEPVSLFFERARHLSDKLGPVLYQLPPHWHVDLPRFEAFLDILPAGYTHVVEFRDPSWLIEDVFRLMERNRVSHCIHDMHPLQIPVRVTASPVYLRLHGDAGNYGDYRREVLEQWASHIRGWRDGGLDVFVYFNNDPGGHALRNALSLRAMLA